MEWIAVAIVTVVAALITGIATVGSSQENIDAAERQAKAQGSAQEKSIAFGRETQTQKAAQEAEQSKALEKKRSEALRIETQRYNIETLADLLRSRSQAPATVIYRTPSAKKESNIIDQINRQIGRIFNA